MGAALKDHIDVAVVNALAHQLQSLAPDRFDAARFTATIEATLPALELKDRINLIADTINAELLLEYPSALAVVVDASKSNLSEWAAWPLCSFVERHGLDHPNESLAAMEQLTQAWSCEFAIRPYLAHHLDLTRTFLRRWTTSPNEDVRRLPSEGTRPLLPWAPRVAALLDDPTIGLELITVLRHDGSETVRRSVANHLNDVSKANPDLVVNVLTQWSTSDKPVDPKLVRHSLRTLVKTGHPGALGLLGFTTDPQVSIDSFTCSPKTIRLGGSIKLNASFTSTSDATQLLVVDFVVHHLTARGSTSPKVFKWTTVSLDPMREVTVTKRRTVKDASTRTYHAGFHQVDLQIAGHTLARSGFTIDR